MPDGLACQTTGCGKPIEVVTLDMRDWTADAECMTCHLTRYMAILAQMHAAGDLPVLDVPPA